MSLAAPATGVSTPSERTFTAAQYILNLPPRPIALLIGAMIALAEHHNAIHRHLGETPGARLFVWAAAALFLVRGAWSVRTTVDIVESEIRRTHMLLLLVPLATRRIPFARVSAIDIAYSRTAAASASDDAGSLYPAGGFRSLFVYGAVLAFLTTVLAELTGGLVDIGHYLLRIETRDHRNPLVYRSYHREPVVRHAETLARILQVRLT